MALDQILQKNLSQQLAIIYQHQQKTYQELIELSDSLACKFIESGIKKGNRVALFIHNCLEMVICYFAIFKVGAVAVPINTRFKSYELAYALQHSEANLLFIEDELLPLYKEIELSFVKLKIFLPSSIQKLKTKNIKKPEVGIDANDLACILYTSGTTGKPKGVMHTHDSLLNTAINQSTTLELDKSSQVLITLPICHMAGFAGQMLTTLYAGGLIILVKQFDPELVLNTIQKYQISQLMMLPMQIEQLIQHPNNTQLSFIKQCIVGGDKVPLTVHHLFHKITGNYLIECCGMTESLSYSINYPDNGKHAGSIGKSIHATKLKIIDNEGHELATNETGEVLVKSLANSIGYWRNPEATQQLLKNDWLYTGDLACKDENGYFWFQGRKKDIIIRGGSNISPLEVEDVLYQHPAVKEVGVIGYPDVSLGQIVHAYVVLNDNQSLSEVDLKQFASRFLADYKIPAKIIFKTSLPHNALGKLDRKKLSKDD